MKPNTLVIIIVNYKTAKLTIDCLSSLFSELNEQLKVVVVDNNSNDGSLEEIQAAIEQYNWTAWIDLIASEINGGFSYGNNLAIRNYLACNNSKPEFICLLNPDTYVNHGAMSSLINFMHDKPLVGIVGSRLEDPDGTGQMSSFKFHDWITELDRGFGLGLLTKLLKPWLGINVIPEKNTRTDWVAGASMMIRTSVFDDVGLLDESYFMYYEEMDFCLQAARAGWQCWYVPESRVIHYVGQSSGVTDNKIKAKRRPQYWFDSRRRYFLKNYGVLRAFMADVTWLFGFAFWRSRNMIQQKTHNYPPYFWRDSLSNSVLIKGVKFAPTKNKLESN